VTREQHPSREDLERFRRGELTAAESKGLVRHLLAGCAECLGATRRLWGGRQASAGAGESEAPPAGYGELFRKLFAEGPAREAAVARDLERAPRLAADLLRHPHERRLTLVANAARFHSVGLCEHLLESAAALWREDPAASGELAEVAGAVARRLDPRCAGPSLAASLEGRAWAYRGNALRLAGAFAAAEEALARADPLIEHGSGDPLERAELHALRAALAADRGRHAAALSLYDRAAQLFRALAERHALGRTLLEKSAVPAPALGEEARLALLREGLGLLDERLEPRLAAAAHHRLVAGLLEAGRAGEALLYLQKARLLDRKQGDQAGLLRLLRLEGKIAEALDRPEEAERLLLEAWMGLVALKLGQDAATVTLDLARLYTHTGRTGEARDLALKLSPLFHAEGLDKGAIVGLVVLRRLLETESADPEFLAQLVGYFRRPTPAQLRQAS
jgi:tetratricopeptide (TPR) repeat protein